jgi:hypothetical protein
VVGAFLIGRNPWRTIREYASDLADFSQFARTIEPSAVELLLSGDAERVNALALVCKAGLVNRARPPRRSRGRLRMNCVRISGALATQRY